MKFTNYQGLGTYKRQTNGRFSSIKAAFKRAVRFTVRWSFISATAYALFMAGAFFYSTSTVTATTVTVEAAAPILDRIAQCESHGQQLNPNGQVLLNINTNGTVDIGIFQINSIHEAEATKLGDDLFTEEGNTAYARFLYSNRGTGDWASSAKCWMK
jgi:hypothetical protein